MEEKKISCFIYLRVSTLMQADGYSLEAQQHELLEEAKHRKWVVTGTYTDAGKSGKNISGRPAFQKMMDDISNPDQRPDYVMVFKLSRFGRSTRDILNSLNEMRAYNVHLYCLKESIDSSSPVGKLMITLLGAIAEIERDNIRTQTMAGRMQMARDGKWNGGCTPYGYKLNQTDNQKKGRLEIVPEEAEVVKKIFELFLQDYGTSCVAKMLNDQGYCKTTGSHRSVEQFNDAFIRSVLDNETYMGYIRYGKTRTIISNNEETRRVRQSSGYQLIKGLHEPIIDESTWYRCHEKRRFNAYKSARSGNNVHILAGLLRCPVCHSRMHGIAHHKKKDDSTYYLNAQRYYLCRCRSNKSESKCSFRTHIRQEIINKELEMIMKQIFNSWDFVINSDQHIECKNKALTFDYQTLQESLAESEDINTAYSNMMHALSALQQQHILTDSVRRMLISKSDISESEKKELLNHLIESIEIHNKPDSNNHWIKSIRFRIPFQINNCFMISVKVSYPMTTNDFLSQEL